MRTILTVIALIGAAGLVSWSQPQKKSAGADAGVIYDGQPIHEIICYSEDPNFNCWAYNGKLRIELHHPQK
jgi:hypothetical protein